MSDRAIENPWKDLKVPDAAAGFGARRIGDVGDTSWGLYWAVDWRRQCLLVLIHSEGLTSQHRWPRLRGLRIERQAASRGQEFLVFRLTDAEHRDLFYRLCTDLVGAAGVARSEQEAVDVCIMRTWRWHRLLKRGRDGRLTAEEQKGLIGELTVLMELVMPAIGVSQGVAAWVGPLGASRDFEIGTVGIESKACAPLASKVRIASEDQLGSDEAHALFLHVTEVAAALGGSPAALTVTQVVERAREFIESQDTSALGEFEERLAATGYDDADEYVDQLWLIGDVAVFVVLEGFPRIIPPMVPPGVIDVRYQISLAECEPFRIDIADLSSEISGISSDD
ncbi:MAG: PD-(D/E)XK motif protein [Gemmatimonadota bacterium]|nr:PD-(D/E)XK motif protein [Gemmatimonadota bacterium]